MARFKILDKLKFMFSSKKENSPVQKMQSKTKHGNPISMNGSNNSIQQADTINNHYSNTSGSEENLVKNLINEMDYNISPGVGCPKCNFEFIYHNELLNSKIRQDLHESIRELIKHMKLCNAYVTYRQLQHLKNQSKILKERLMNETTSFKKD